MHILCFALTLFCFFSVRCRFCGETEEEHLETVGLLQEVGYDTGFFFAYSERGKTKAARSLPDDVPEVLEIWGCGFSFKDRKSVV